MSVLPRVCVCVCVCLIFIRPCFSHRFGDEVEESMVRFESIIEKSLAYNFFLQIIAHMPTTDRYVCCIYNIAVF